MRSVVVGVLVIGVSAVWADHSEHRMEEVFVDGQVISSGTTSVRVNEQGVVDTAQALKVMPGANVNSNGTITGIAQYRGLFGDRVAVTIDGASYISGGPNAMDSPLSYSSPLLTESLTLTRGIAGVSVAPESMGGHFAATLARGEFSEQGFDISGFVAERYNGNGDQYALAGRVTGASASHKVSLLAEIDRGDDISTPAGDVIPSEMARDRVDLSYAYRDEASEALVYAGRLDTQESGTPALAMDIRSIETDLMGVSYQYRLNEALRVHARFDRNDVSHWMDNFTLRRPPMMAMGYRQNYAEGEGNSALVSMEYAASVATLRVGANLTRSAYDSTITNPNAPPFVVRNFNDISRDLNGVYVEAVQNDGAHQWELGARYNRVSTDAGEVSASGLSGMMAMNAGMLSNNFNAADRKLDFSDGSAVAKYAYVLTDAHRLSIALASKARAPSHQELYLWLPLAATGGLADGRSYVGNLELKSERARELNIGWDFSSESVKFSPQVFIKKIDNYIQGTPSNNAVANMVATMMSGAPALQFNNVDAELWGIDVAWNYSISQAFFIEGTVSKVSGTRTDMDDNLYRQSPDNMRTALHYAHGKWHLTAESHLYAEQNDVSSYNGELRSAAYGLVNLRAEWQAIDALVLELNVTNLGDKRYQDHLAGVNRASGSGIAVGDRIYGGERAVAVGLTYRF